jgi:DNA-binding transcriptional regulator YhcF (GntR family)
MYRHIVDSLAADITNGRLLHGQQLPTLPNALGIDLTTVARACTKAHSSGLHLTLSWRSPR